MAIAEKTCETYPSLKEHVHRSTDLIHKASHSDRITRGTLVTDGYLVFPMLIAGPLHVVSQNELGNDHQLSIWEMDSRRSGCESWSWVRLVQGHSRYGDRRRSL